METERVQTVLTILLVGAGGALGSIARYLMSHLVQRSARSGFPWGTLVVNASGSFLIGAVFALFDGGIYASQALIFLVAGVLGGYTTFSTFSIENMKLIDNRQHVWLIANTVGQVAGGLVLAGAGYWFCQAIIR